MFTDVKNWSALSDSEQDALLQRPVLGDHGRVAERAAEIVATVQRRGDAALREYASRFDGCELDELRVGAPEFAAAEASLPDRAIAAIDTAIANVRRFHEQQLPGEIDICVIPGVRCQRQNRPIDAVGLYVPAGTAPLPSTAIMLAVPAAIAACPRRVLCTPPGPDGKVDAATLLAAHRSGVTEVFKVGGAQAIAAMAYGTESVPAVERIFGPGNAWVTAAKILVSSDPAGASIDLPAGPSEVLVIADDTANPAFVAADLLSQAEHGEDSHVVLLTNSRRVADNAVAEIGKQLRSLKRQSIAREALRHARIILTDSVAAAIDISNRYAPEHLILQIASPRSVLGCVTNAGSVFLGSWSPESVGDYCSGTNHVLPTCGAARSFSGLGVDQFMRRMTIQELSEAGLRSLAPTVVELAMLEGLDAHANAVRLRLDDVRNEVPA